MIPINFPFPRTPKIEQFDYYASVSITNTSTQTTVVTATIPSSVRKGWITAFGHGIDDPTYFQTSVWRIMVNGNAIPYYFAIVDQLAPFNDPREIAASPFKGGDVISVVASNAGAAAKLYAARLRGFFDYGDV